MIGIMRQRAKKKKKELDARFVFGMDETRIANKKVEYTGGKEENKKGWDKEDISQLVTSVIWLEN